jgi:hypothetical protein
MQSLPVYLYPNSLDVILDLDPTVRGVNQVMYQRDLKIQKGIKNKVRIQFKNSDQKPVPIANASTFVFNMFDSASQELVLQKPLTILDDSVELNQSQDQGGASNTLLFGDVTGISVGQSVSGFGIGANSIVNTIAASTVTSSTYIVTLNHSTTVAINSATALTFSTLNLRGAGELTINESDTIDLDSVPYKYSVIYQDPADGTYLPAYTNTYYGMSGTLYLTEEVYPKLKPSQEITSFLKSYNSAPSVMAYEHKSGNVYAYPELNANSALHTMALYMTAYKGTVQIQATLYNSPQSFGRYVTISTLTYDGFTGVDYVNFNGVFSYVRVVYVPAKDITNNNDNPAYYGSFDKVLYRS